MKKVFIGMFLLALFVAACNEPTTTETAQKRVAKGNREYGGAFKVNERDEFQSLFPYGIIDAVSHKIASQIYEGLVTLNTKDLSIKLRIAESWELSEDGMVYTFQLKRGCYFHDDSCFPDGKGREIKASDFKYSFELLCTENINDSISNLMFARTFKDKVKGANAYYEASKNGKPDFDLAGINVIDDYTITITLNQPSASFIYILAYPAASVVAKEAVDKYGDMLIVGSGPFAFEDYYEETDELTGEPVDYLILVRNKSYHGFDSLGNQLPYLDSIVISFYNSQKRELALFQEKNLDMILGLPAESVRDIVEQQITYFERKPPIFILERSADMSTQFYEFNLNNNVFSDEGNGKKVRQAISYAIDRNKIIEKVLSGEAYGPGIYGITPPSFKNYKNSTIKGYSFDPEKAKALLAEAGYPNGVDFPTIKLELNSGGFRNTSVAFEIQKQLSSVLNINLELEIVSMARLLEDRRNAKGDIFRSAWIADYPSPENFLLLMYGKNVPAELSAPSFLNTPRYVNAEFDEIYEKGIAADVLSDRYGYFAQAEQIMMDDAPIVILWYDEQYRLLQSNVRNFYINAMHFRDFSEVYFQEMKVEEGGVGNEASSTSEEASAEMP
ncbi:MAG TPA: peptide ABC transporter substrate-binding protein [Flavobacteriales bacterium]|nr:peptide ABC transporter substrate-binding protein [Flavobacteriales bacterium]